MATELDDCSRKLLHHGLGVSPDEEFGIVFDRYTDIVQSLQSVAGEEGFSTRMIEIPGDRSHSGPIPDAEADLHACDAVIAPTKFSISHSPETTNARKKSGTRFLTLPGITEEIYRKIGRSDPEEIDRFNEQLHEQLRGTTDVRITTPSGTDVTLELDPTDRDWHRDGLSVRDPGDLANAPAGEIFTAPLEDGAEGRIVIDRWRSITPDREATLELTEGSISNHNDAAKPLIDELQSSGPSGFIIAELGIGTNRSHEEPIGNILHDEKIYGTCHIAFGMNTSLGGVNESSVHQDVVLEDPTLVADGETVEFPK